jgi:hypothetical protein
MGGSRRRGRRVATLFRTFTIYGGGRFFSGGEDLVVIPRRIVIFKGSIKGGDFAVDDELCDDVFFPIFTAGIDPLGSQITKVDRILVMSTVRRR